jgi:hypothetical protein
MDVVRQIKDIEQPAVYRRKTAKRKAGSTAASRSSRAK